MLNRLLLAVLPTLGLPVGQPFACSFDHKLGVAVERDRHWFVAPLQRLQSCQQLGSIVGLGLVTGNRSCKLQCLAFGVGDVGASAGFGVGFTVVRAGAVDVSNVRGHGLMSFDDVVEE